MSKQKLNPAKFAREVKQEALRVSWPSRKETLISAGIVLTITAVASLFFMTVDSLAAWLIQLILGIGR